MKKVILLGDLHFGLKRFSLNFLNNQLKLFDEQIFPYMEENNINEIYQLGDIFDNRTTLDIIWLETLKRNFFQKIKDKGFILYTLLGNHDIAYRETRDISLSEIMSEIYPDNYKIFKERVTIDLCGRETYIVPWITKDETLTYDEIRDKEIILGHFEIRNFAMVKGHIDTSSYLTEDFFKKETKVDQVFSGHYHIKNTYGDVKYLGVPFQMNWNDFALENGFYVWDGFNLEFKENTSSKKFVKIKYSDEDLDEHERTIEIEGFFKAKKLLNEAELKQVLPLLERHEVKFLINHAKDRHFDEILYTMKEAKIQPAAVIDNQEISKIIGTDYLSNFEDSENIEIENTRQLILDTVTEHKESLLPLMLDILSEVDSMKDKEI